MSFCRVKGTELHCALNYEHSSPNKVPCDSRRSPHLLRPGGQSEVQESGFSEILVLSPATEKKNREMPACCEPESLAKPALWIHEL